MSPFKTLYALYLSVLCQRVTLYFKILCVAVSSNAANGQKKSISVHRLRITGSVLLIIFLR